MKTLGRMGDGLDLPPAAVTERHAFLGMSGSGKTYAAMKMAELMLAAGAQVVVLDPVGPWRGLRSSADGKRPGFPVAVFGGVSGDIPLAHDKGALVADVLVDRGISAVLDVSDFTGGQMGHFVSDFAERFHKRKARSPGPVHLFLEEAHFFIPQQLPPGERGDRAGVMLGRVDRLVRVGRNHGVGTSIITQQPQSVIKIAKKVTFDSSKTPEFGDAPAAQRVLAPVDAEALRAAMAEVVAEAERDDPAALRARVRSLEGEVRALRAAPAPRVQPTVVPAIEAAEMERLEAACARVAALRESAERASNESREAVAALAAAWERASALVREAARLRGVPPEPTDLAARRGGLVKRVRTSAEVVIGDGRHYLNDRPIRAGKKNGDIGLKLGARRMLAAIVAAGGLTQREVGVWSGLCYRGGTFARYLSDLRSGDLVRDDGGRLIPTAGAKEMDLPPQPIDVLGVWQSGRRLKAGARRMLEAISQARSLSRADVAQVAGLAADSGTFARYLSDLRRNGLVETDGALLRPASPL